MTTTLDPSKADTARRVAALMASGTTTRADDLTVLWVGEHLALVKHLGGSYYDNGGRNYVAPWVDVVDIETVGKRYGQPGSIRRHVWDCSRDGDGRLTPKRLAALIDEWQERDAGWADEVAAEVARREAERHAEERRRQQERRVRQAEHARDQIGELILSACAKGNDKILSSLAANYRKAPADLELVQQGHVLE